MAITMDEDRNSRRFRFRLAIKLSIALFILGGAACLVNHYRYLLYFPVKTVRVYGVEHIEHKKVQHALSSYVAGNFFTVDVDAMRLALLDFPWVAEAAVRRVWPGSLNVSIIEKKPIASWNNKALLSDTGQLFNVNNLSEITDLPELSGPQDKELVVFKYYLQMSELLEPLSQKIVKLTLTPYATWNITLDSGISLRIGHQQVLTRLGRFVKVYSKIIGTHAADVDYVDLRYSNGVAVKWKKRPVKA